MLIAPWVTTCDNIGDIGRYSMLRRESRNSNECYDNDQLWSIFDKLLKMYGNQNMDDIFM